MNIRIAAGILAIVLFIAAIGLLYLKLPGPAACAYGVFLFLLFELDDASREE